MAKTQKQKTLKSNKKLKTKTKSKSKSKKSEKSLPSSSNHKPQKPQFYSEAESEFDPNDLQDILEPFTKDQLIDLIAAAAINNATIRSLVRSQAVSDVSNRKIFVHGLGWETTRQSLFAVFEPFGQIEDCHVVLDKASGKCKGYGFVVFSTRKGASKALKEPRKKINDRVASCQLAARGAAVKESDPGARKIYVTNVPKLVDRERLRCFFEKFGEIEAGPIGFCVNTGMSRGFALFVYRDEIGAKKALEEPSKMFEGQQLYCQKAAEGRHKNKSVPEGRYKNKSVDEGVQSQGQQQQQQQQQGQVLPVASQPQQQQQGQQVLPMAQQNLALFGQNPGFSNPMFGGLWGNPLNSLMAAGALSQSMMPRGPLSQLGGLGGASSSPLGSLGAAQGLQQLYPNMQQIAQQGTAKGPAATGTFPSNQQ